MVTGRHRDWLLAESDPPSKRSVLEAALRLFVRHGRAATTIRMIADEAGYTNPALFKFFDSKEALAVHLFERCYGRLYGRIASAVSGTFDQERTRMVDAFLAQMDEDLEAALYVQDSLRELWPKLPPSARKRSILRVVRQVVGRGIREER